MKKSIIILSILAMAFISGCATRSEVPSQTGMAVTQGVAEGLFDFTSPVDWF